MQPDLKLAEMWANLLDNQWHLGSVRFGLDALFDVIPGGGDLIAALLSLYLIWIGIKLRLPPIKILHMLINIGVDFIIGTIPVIGDLGYLFFKSNLANLGILKKHFGVA